MGEIIMKIRGISVFNKKPIEVEIKEGFIKNIHSLAGSRGTCQYHPILLSNW